MPRGHGDKKQLWWGQVRFKEGRLMPPGTAIIGRIIFVEAGCKCDARNRILAVFDQESKKRAIKSRDIYETYNGLPGPYEAKASVPSPQLLRKIEK